MKVKKITYYLDGDALEVVFKYNDECGIWHGEYPDFSECPRYTPSGRPWVDVTKDDCIYANDTFNDCGSCEYFKRQNATDLLGICMNDNKRLPTDSKEEKSQ